MPESLQSLPHIEPIDRDEVEAARAKWQAERDESTSEGRRNELAARIAGMDDHEADEVHSAPPCWRSMPALRILSAALNTRMALRSGISAPCIQFWI